MREISVYCPKRTDAVPEDLMERRLEREIRRRHDAETEAAMSDAAATCACLAMCIIWIVTSFAM